MNGIKALIALSWPILIAVTGCASNIPPTSVVLPLTPPDIVESMVRTETIQTIKIAPSYVLPCSSSTSDSPAQVGLSVCRIDISVAVGKDGKCIVQVAQNVQADAARTAFEWVIKPIDPTGNTVEFADYAGPPIVFTNPGGHVSPARRILPNRFVVLPTRKNRGNDGYYTIYLQWRDAKQTNYCTVDPIINND